MATKLCLPLEKDHLDAARKRGLIFTVNRAGKVICTSRDSGWCGIGRSPRQALEDWLEKMVAEDKGSN